MAGDGDVLVAGGGAGGLGEVHDDAGPEHVGPAFLAHLGDGGPEGVVVGYGDSAAVGGNQLLIVQREEAGKLVLASEAGRHGGVEQEAELADLDLGGAACPIGQVVKATSSAGEPKGQAGTDERSPAWLGSGRDGMRGERHGAVGGHG